MSSAKEVGNPEIIIGLLWHSITSDNIGIGALTASHIQILDEIAMELGTTVSYVIMCWKDPNPPFMAPERIKVLHMRMRHLISMRGLYAAVRSCDLVLDISAGDSFADIYGPRRFLLNCISKFVVLLARKPLILSPQTIGPFERWWSRLLAGILMRRSQRVVTRDSLSSDYAKRFGLGSKLLEATDVAFRLPYREPGSDRGGPVKIGLNVSGLLFNGGYSGNNMFQLKLDYPQLTRRMLELFTSERDCEVHLIGHVNSLSNPVEDDYRVIERLAAEFPGVIVAPRFANPSEAKSYIASMDFFCGSRMHACIAAFSSGVPVVPLAYSRKFAGLFGSLHYPFVADCRNDSAEQILSTLEEALRNRADLKKAVDQGRKLALEKLSVYETVLRTTMVEALRKTG